MNVIVNGENTELAEQSTVLDVLVALELPTDAKGIAVAVGMNVVPRSEWSSWVLAADDQVEVVTATQGG